MNDTTDHATAARDALEEAHEHRSKAHDQRHRPDGRALHTDRANDALCQAAIHANLAIAAALTTRAGDQAAQHGHAPEPMTVHLAPREGRPLSPDERPNLLDNIDTRADYLIPGQDLHAIVAQLDAAADAADGYKATRDDLANDLNDIRRVLDQDNRWAELRDALGAHPHLALRTILGYQDEEPGA